MKLQAILSKTTTDMLKSKQLSKEVAQLVLDVYCTPDQLAQIINNFYDEKFTIELNGKR